jgi:hypothetical protein
MKTKDGCVQATDSVAGGVSAALECGSLLPLSFGWTAAYLQDLAPEDREQARSRKKQQQAAALQNGTCEISTNEPRMSMKTKDKVKKSKSREF